MVIVATPQNWKNNIAKNNVFTFFIFQFYQREFLKKTLVRFNVSQIFFLKKYFVVLVF